MAYLQGYQQPRIITLSPDAFIFINGQKDVGTCTECNKKIKIDNFTNISVTLNVDGSPGSASFALTAPRQQKDKLIQFDQPIIKPMFEVEIFMKGRFSNEDSESVFYPVFWGVVSNVSYSFSGGFHTLDVGCKDILRFWEITKINMQPAQAHNIFTSYSGTAFGSAFHDMNPYEMIWKLNDLISAGSIVPADMFTSISNETIRKFRASQNNLMEHWQRVFSTTRNGKENIVKTLRMVGFNGEVRFDQREVNRDKENESEKVAYNKGVVNPKIEYDTSFIEEFHPLADVSKGAPSVYESEIQSRLEVALQIKNRIGFEFYMDTTGDIIFKPPFYNMDVRNNPFYVIEGSDIISISFDEDESAVEATRADIKGRFSDYHATGEIRPSATFIDYNLSRKFGLRSAEFVADFLRDKDSCFTYATDYLEKINNYLAGTITIPLRAELRMGFPIYIKPYDCFAYIKGIAHTFTMGGPSTTTLTLEKFRRKYIAQEGTQLIGTSIDAKGNFIGAPNRSILLKKITKTSTTIKKEKAKTKAVAETNRGGNESTRNSDNITVERQITKQKDAIQLANLSSFYLANLASEVTEIVGSGFNKETYLKDLRNELPISDENGYELIGVYPYGRNVTMNETTNGAIELIPKTVSFSKAKAAQNNKVNDKKTKKGSSAVGSGVRAIERFNLGGAALKLSQIDPESKEGSGQSCTCQQRQLERILQAVRFRRG